MKPAKRTDIAPAALGDRFRRFAGRLTGDRSGTTVVEFGLMMPIFIVFVLGTVEFSRVMWTDHALDYAAEQGTRYALAHQGVSTSQVKAVAENQLEAVDRSAVTVTAVQETVNGIDYMVVTATYPYQPYLPLIPIGSITLTGISRTPFRP